MEWEFPNFSGRLAEFGYGKYLANIRTMARPNSPDMAPKCTKKVRLGIIIGNTDPNKKQFRNKFMRSANSRQSVIKLFFSTIYRQCENVEVPFRCLFRNLSPK